MYKGATDAYTGIILYSCVQTISVHHVASMYLIHNYYV